MRLENLDGFVDRDSEYKRVVHVTTKIAAISYPITSKVKKLLTEEKKRRATQNLCGYCGEPNHTILNCDLAFKNRTRYDTKPNNKQLVSAITALEQDREIEKTQTHPPI
jgi:formate dehydrogenase assembly factor FdhD